MLAYSDDIPFIEDNQSRIPNRYFQKYMSDVFQGTFVRYFSNLIGPRVIVIDFWDLVTRKETVTSFLGHTGSQLKFEYGSQEN
jgi:hypothetical protein